MPKLINKIEIHIIQPLQAANPNRGEDGGVKSIHYGGYDRPRISSQSQKKAARDYYRDNVEIRSELGLRSGRHWINLAPQLTAWADEGDRVIIAKLVLGLFNFGPEKLLPCLLEDESNLIFLADCEVATLAELTNQNKETFDDWLERGKDFLEIIAQRIKKAVEEKTKNSTKTLSDSELEKIRSAVISQVQKEYDRQLTKNDIGKFRKAIITQFDSSIPGEIALFGRMMATLVETSVDGCVQVSHAMGLTQLPRVRGNDGYASGSIDFFSACDQIEPLEDANSGAAMIGEVRFTAPTYYRNANVNVTEFIQRLGENNKELAPKMISAFIEGFVKKLPSGYERSFAHQTMPVFVMFQVTSQTPLQYSPPFENVLIEPEGGKSISQIAVQKLVEYQKEVCYIYDRKDKPYYSYAAVTALSSHYNGTIVPLEDAIAGAVAAAIG